ncbi:hypothetical protein ACIQPP_09145 [Streptomyces violaceusniger]|uniref:hypothetical protein n=1 Tax=Streptomyces violaceusniger TaxID=68280 RepID=UPI00193B2D68|nr:hypothetical protein [Streptomyces hygroscopicus]
MERWVQICRRELLGRPLVWNQRHPLYALRQFEHFDHSHHAHQGTANARPPHPLPTPITDPEQLAGLDRRRRERLGGILNEYRHAARPARMSFPASALASVVFVVCRSTAPAALTSTSAERLRGSRTRPVADGSHRAGRESSTGPYLSPEQ